jgi:leucyl aminopeptidase (aminopeptidase T)
MLGIYNILAQRYNLQPEQSVLVIYDDKKQTIARGFMSMSRQIGARVKGIKLGKRRFEGKINGILRTIEQGGFDLYINVFEAKVEETKYRIALTRAESEAGGAIGHGPGITKRMVSVAVDYNDLNCKATALKKILNGAVYADIKSKRGTDIRLYIKDRKFLDDVSDNSSVSNIPCGEIWCAPVEGKGDGVIVSDGSIGSLGLLPQPLVLEVSDGHWNRMYWLYDRKKNRALMRKITSALTIDEGARNIGEFGIGLAPFEVSGNMLQDEKAAGTIHIAFGDSSFYGGNNTSKTHMDLLVRSPTVTAHYARKKPRKFMEKGKLIL